MLKIVVADDEENVRDIVANYINSVSTEYTVVGRAENGKKALELIRELQPDILISDICMPVMDGLELIQAVNALAFPVKNLIISGYNEFSYAQKAIGLGVSEYLLKPFSPNELMQILDRLRTEIDRQSTLEKNFVMMQDELEKNRLQQREACIRAVIEGESDELTVLEDSRRLGLDFIADMYCVCSVKCESVRSTPKDIKAVFEQLFDSVSDSYFENRIKAYVTSMKNGNIILLFTGNYQNDISFRNGIDSGLHKMIESMGKYYDISLQCCVGKIYHDWKQIVHSKNEAETIWRGIVNNQQSLTFYSDYEKQGMMFHGEHPDRPVRLEKELLVQIQMNRQDDAIDTLADIVHYYEAYPLTMQGFVSISLIELVLSISSMVKEAGGSDKLWENQEMADYITSHFQERTLKQICKVLQEYVICCCDEFSRLNEKQSDKIVWAVKDLIEKNISNDEFNLDMISQELFFSIHYIRQVFKQKTGENILEYLIKRRMEKAGELLNAPDSKIVDVAEKTGYKNQRYFATAFKKYFGCTPTEYKKSIEN